MLGGCGLDQTPWLVATECCH